MGKVCKCDQGMLNTGTACTVNGSVILLSLFFSKYDSNNELAGIDFDAVAVNGVIPKAFIDGKLNAANPKDRWYPIGNFKNVENVRAEAVTESFNDGDVAKIKDGIKTFAGVLPKKNPKYKAILDSFACNDELVVVHVDVNGTIVGQSFDGNFVQGLDVNNESFDPNYVETTDTTIVKVSLNYSYKQNTDDGNLYFITADGTETDMTSVRGLKDVDLLEEVAATTTELSVEAVLSYNASANNKLTLSDLVVGDFTLINKTQGGTPVAFTLDDIDAAQGIYKLEYTTGVAANDELIVGATKAGYEIKSITMTAS
jgi:hypothetical protein